MLQRAVGHTIRGKVIAYTVCGAVVLVYAGSLAILEAERDQPGAKITSFGDAVVGHHHGHHRWIRRSSPVTSHGTRGRRRVDDRWHHLVGTVTATLASWIVQRVAEEDTASEAATRAQIEELREEIRRLSNLVTHDREPAYGEAREGI